MIIDTDEEVENMNLKSPDLTDDEVIKTYKVKKLERLLLGEAEKGQCDDDLN